MLLVIYTKTCQHLNFDQLIVEPTHFTESSSYIIDLIFTSNKSSILLSGVGDPFLGLSFFLSLLVRSYMSITPGSANLEILIK